MNRITEYLCDYCDSIFISPLLVKMHQQKSCLGTTTEKDEIDQWKKIKYIESNSTSPTKCERCGMVFIERGLDKTGKDWKEWKDWKDWKGHLNIKCIECKEKESVYSCGWSNYVKKYH